MEHGGKAEVHFDHYFSLRYGSGRVLHGIGHRVTVIGVELFGMSRK
jgi:hypothetical protein